jgi:hypothetical protein
MAGSGGSKLVIFVAPAASDKPGVQPFTAQFTVWCCPLANPQYNGMHQCTNRGEAAMSTWVPLLVRREDYMDFAEQVASREAGREEPEAPPSVNTAAAATAATATKEAELLSTLKTWSMDSLRQLANSGEEFVTAERWGKAIDVACNHVGKFISSMQVAAEAGMPINEWRDAPRKLPAHLAAHYEPNIEWPLMAVRGRELKKDDQIYWGITAEQAQRWLQVRAERD